MLRRRWLLLSRIHGVGVAGLARVVVAAVAVAVISVAVAVAVLAVAVVVAVVSRVGWRCPHRLKWVGGRSVGRGDEALPSFLRAGLGRLDSISSAQWPCRDG